ncbi:LPXTG-motif cell wall anchor domain-containingprotein [Purpureocillium lavendulum]|uniref:LPXTG-motif cell wall anchor domain-containingprotein n=1 Tax=Purpureocillium lavendulum TaxID=1247861 RepID=A0AB34G4K9_9HYPO|nr:LPXTG-motif cell wall anchor domain-containingprotein [Purpureocillium lavendulum]
MAGAVSAAAAPLASGSGPKTLVVTGGAGATAVGGSVSAGTTTAATTATTTTSGTTGPDSHKQLETPTTTTSPAAAGTRLPLLTSTTTTTTIAANTSAAADRGNADPRNDPVDSDSSNGDDARSHGPSASLKHPHRPAYLRLRDHKPPAASTRAAQSGPSQDTEAAPPLAHPQQHLGLHQQHQDQQQQPALPVSPDGPPPRPANRLTSSPTATTTPDAAVVSTELNKADSQAQREIAATKEGSDQTSRHSRPELLFDWSDIADDQPAYFNRRLLGVARRRHAADFVASQQSPGGSTTSPSDIQGHRELLLPKRLSQSSSSDESRHSSSHRPPISYKPPTSTTAAQSGASTPVRVPPIRGFRSSGSRKSLALDMNFRPRAYDLGDDSRGTIDNTLRALEGRYSDDSRRSSTLSPGRQNGSPSTFDDTGDVFLRIARDEPGHQPDDDPLADDVQSSITTSPPRMSRRLSDQQDRPRMRNADDDQPGEVSRAVTYRNLMREKAASAHPGEDAGRARAGSSTLRPSPLAFRPLTASQEPNSEPSVYARRRASITENNSTVGARSSTYKSATGPQHGKSYSSSPLVRTFESHNREPGHGGGVEGTESTASTTAPSTVWDELDDLKSRIHRLELTGKLPSTSGAAVSRMSDERPATATTTVTTMSLSPKRQPGGQVADAVSTTSSQREGHPLLVSALAKSKPFMSPDVYRALESAASDAVGLSALMGSPGQPGPISSGASVIGTGGNVTDRQLRRKADSVCRSLTELCVALGEDVTLQPRLAPPAQVNMAQMDGPATPTMPKTYSGLPAPRRSSIAADQNLPKPVGSESPRTLSKFEERRNQLLNGTPLSIPRPTPPSAPMSADANVNRRSSLMVARTRRATTEEPDDGRGSSLLRTRRGGTEEPDEGRRTSLLVRHRRGTVGEERDEGRFRAPSRANTEVNMLRGPGRDYAPEAQASPSEASGQSADSARRRLTSTSFRTSRLAIPSGSGPAPPRRYLEKATPDRDASTNEYVTRQPQSSPSAAHARASSLGTRRNRDSIISNPPTTAGTYR